jgi:glycosyltransferase involved in cell wall biosynthesis
MAVLVANGVHGDSRVQRMARAAADGGWEVLVVGRSPDGAQHRSTVGAAQVVLVPVPAVLGARGGPLRDPGGVVRLQNRCARAVLARRDRAAGHRDRTLRHGAWRVLDPWVQDLELAMAPVVEAFDPDLVHAHDRHTIALAARSAAVLTAAHPERPVRWVLDAHEHVASTAARGRGGLRGRLRRAMVAGQQAEFVGEADAVVTVSATLARMLRDDHGLAEVPTVVLNAPEPSPADDDEPVPGLRERTGLGPDVPLLVYVGGCAPARGVGSVVQALGRLPGVHLVLVASPDDADAGRLVAAAADHGAAGRVHRVDYVDPRHVTRLLRDADAGSIPLLHRPNHEISLVTKFLECLHAGLPVVVSDVREMAAFTREHDLGEVHRAGDADDVAAAVTRLLARRDELRERVATSEAVRDTSWPAQVRVLLALYDRLVPPGYRERR